MSGERPLVFSFFVRAAGRLGSSVSGGFFLEGHGKFIDGNSETNAALLRFVCEPVFRIGELSRDLETAKNQYALPNYEKSKAQQLAGAGIIAAWQRLDRGQAFGFDLEHTADLASDQMGMIAHACHRQSYADDFRSLWFREALREVPLDTLTERSSRHSLPLRAVSVAPRPSISMARCWPRFPTTNSPSRLG